MKLKHVTLENFRGFKKLELTLDPQLTVLVGANGAGKSSVLDAIAILLSRITSYVRGGAGRRDIRELDISNLSSNTIIGLKALEQEEFSWGTLKVKRGHTAPTFNKKPPLKLSLYAKHIKQIITDANGLCSIPLFSYYPVNRAVLDIPLRIRKSHDFNLLSAWDGSLTSASNFRSFFEWFREREDLENEIKSYKLSDELKMLLSNSDHSPDSAAYQRLKNDYKDPQLLSVRQALYEFLPEFESFAVRRSPLRMVVQKHAQEVRVDQLSDGEKCLIALVADIARRLAIANPTLNAPLQGEGVVLIDEVDLHLHPAWQRMVLPKLTATFPNCQFIVSTHSPQILGEVDASQIRILSQDENNEIHCHIPQQAKGLTSNEVLNELMSWDGSNLARNVEVEEQLDTLFKLIDDEDFVQAKAKIAQMKTALHGSLPDIVQAEALMSMMEADLVDDTK